MMMGFGMFFGLLIWVVLILAGIWAVRSFQVRPPGHKPPASPEEIVRMRYARGEVTREEYERLLEDLRR